MAFPMPLIVCGKVPQVAIGVREGLKPAYDAIHIMMSVESGINEIPSLLQGYRPSANDSENLGSQRYGQKPVAIVTGGGYSDDDFAKMRKACEGLSSVPWLRHDLSNSFDPSNARPKLGLEYGKQIAERVKNCLKELAESGKMNNDGVYYY
ncbi:hypothetical protein BGW36DRAFT_427084 [Talaromyces proteolyticus]|uniref:Uncharacterized protein n=1 Tax=Talaromyces proteolyticus TaxID=1131652 RepID=A0AAD4Q0B8_9EURO|nr:uncharacterized protein BGW36DRAFT_427084 [Talaromyces proteolyticus]KAH8697111.1 hypothetical protein BGW36DRAFT_427084 [Talaromyces proteolyticus]